MVFGSLFALTLALLWRAIANGRNGFTKSEAYTKKLFSDYGFRLSTDTDIPAGGYIDITFPSQYREYLGIPLYPKCNIRCNRYIGSVRFYFDAGLIAGTVIKDIVNPDKKGGTGNFEVRSMMGSNSIDENLIFGTIGMGESPQTLRSTSIAFHTTGGVANAGLPSQYAFNFKTVSFIPMGSYFRITLPKGAGYSASATPSCNFLPVLGNTPMGTLICTYSPLDGQILITGLGQDLIEGTVLSLRLTLTNPPQTITAPKFRIEILRSNTQYIYDWKDNLVGPSINAGLLSGISVAPIGDITELAKGKTDGLTFGFTISNPIQAGGMIEVTVPTSFTFLDEMLFEKPTTYYVLSGLDSASTTDKITLVYNDDSTKLQITGFKDLPAGSAVTLVLTATSPNQDGISESFIVTTYQNKSLSDSIVDQDSSLFTVTVANIVADISADYLLSNNVAMGTGFTDYMLRLKTTVDLLNTLKLTFRGITLNPASTCRRNLIVSGSVVTVNYPGIVVSGSTVTITLTPSTIAALSVGEIYCQNLIRLPNVAKTYSVDMVATDASNAKVMSTVQRISFISKPLTSIISYNIPAEADSNTALFVYFSYTQIIPVSSLTALASDLNSEIRLYFVGIGSVYVKSDLGYGFLQATDIPCKGQSGIFPQTGNSLRCRVFPGSKPYIQIMNYLAIPASTNVVIIIPKFYTPADDYTTYVKVLSTQNDVYNELANANIDVVLVANPALTANAIVLTNPEVTYTVDYRRVSQNFALTFNINADKAITAGERLRLRLPFYDTGFVTNPASVVCKLNDVPVTCIPFMGVDSFLIEVPTTLPYGAGFQNYIKIEGLQWPRYIQTNDNVYIDLITAANQTEKIYTYAAMLQPMANFFQKFIINADKTKRGEANVVYTMTFQTKNDIPDGATLQIDLPVDYTLLASYPAVQVFFPDFTSSTTAKLSYNYSSARIVIEHIGAYPKSTDFHVLVKGVKNPSTLTVMSSWTVQLLYNTNLIEQFSNFASFSLDELVTPKTITLNSISAFPDNMDLKSDHSFSFTPRTALKEGATITITFPSQYRLLPSEPICTIGGQLNSFESCTTDLNTINVVLNTQFTSGTISLKIKDITNPVAGETDKFIVSTSYDGQIIDIIDTSTKTGKTIFVTGPPMDIYMTEFSYDPQNEGEISTYRFGFNPNIKLTSAMQIVIRFPESFDNNIGDKVQCYPIKNLNGNIKCTFIEKIITITRFDDVQVSDDNPIIIEIRGAVNPNRVVNGDSGTISLGVLYSGSTSFLAFVEEAGVVETVEAPGWTFFQKLTTSNQYSRFTSDYKFNFTVFDSIPNADSGGLVIIDLPLQFSPSDSSISCSVDQSETYGSPNCTIQNNRIYISGNDQYYTGHLDLTISKLLNPLDQVQSSYFYIKTYDGFRKKIIERSFYNLDPFFYDYSFAGPTIKVNNDAPIVVEAGTQSVDLWITLDRLSSLDIIVKPNSIPGVSFIPYQVPIGIGENKAKIRVSISESFSIGDYLIEWKILKDLIPSYYSPIRPTKMTVTKSKGVPITVEAINDVPFGGTSLPCKFSVANAPDSGFEIHINTKFDYKGIALDKNIIYFTSGMNEATFSVVFTDPKAAAEENLATGQIEISLTGENADVYMLNTLTLYFNIIQEDITPPNIVEMKLVSIDQYSVVVSVTADDVVACYYMLALKGTAQPDISEVRNQGPPQILTTQSRYGYMFISTGTNSFTFDGLQPSTEYIIYAYAEDRGSNINGDPTVLTFNTADKSRAVETSLQFTQAVMNDAEKDIVRRAVAFKLSLPFSNVIEKKYDVSSKQLYVPATGYLPLIISPLYTNPNFPDMLDQAQLLNTAEVQTYIKSKMATFVMQTYTLSKYPIYTPFLVKNPELVGETKSSLSFAASLSNYGWLYAVANPKSTADDATSIPSPYQIWKGYDSFNKEIKSVQVEVLEPNINYTIEFTGLQSATIYEVFVVAGSNHPNFPDLQSSGAVVSLESMTVDPSDDDSSWGSLKATVRLTVIVALLMVAFA